MKSKEIILCDVDGVVADLMGGFADWLKLMGADMPMIDISKIEMFDIRQASRLPSLIETDERLRARGMWPAPDGEGGINGAFMEFMHGWDAYVDVEVISGAREGILELQEDYDVRFVTALMDAAPEHIPSKMKWMKNYFPTVPCFTAPSKLKMDIRGDIGIDDRYDTCMRWEAVDVRSYVFKQSWNEAPEGHPRYDWSNIVKAIKNNE